MRNTYNTCIPLVAHYVSEPLRGSELLLCYRPHPRLHSLRSLSLGLLKSVPLRGTVCNPPSAYLDAPAPRKPLPPNVGVGFIPILQAQQRLTASEAHSLVTLG